MVPVSGPAPRCLASLAAARCVDGVRIRSLQWAIGLFCVVLGTLILVAPHRFSPIAFAPLVPHRPWIASWLLLGGLALVGVAGLAPRRALVTAAHGLASLAVLVLAWGGVL